jgi:hypothetical protein
MDITIFLRKKLNFFRQIINRTQVNTNNLTLKNPTNNISTAILKTFITNGMINANNKIIPQNGTLVSYDSAKNILLSPGFEVNSTSGASFKAIIKGCLH